MDRFNSSTDCEPESVYDWLLASTIGDLESAIVRDLLPGSYTAVVRGVNDTTGIALVEIYALK